MMDPAVKTAMAFCVLLGGLCAATLFRRERPEGPVTPSSEQQFLLRCNAETEAASLAAQQREQWAKANRERPRKPRPATVVTPLDRHESPPSLAADYPEPDRPASSYSGGSMEMMLPAAASTDSPQTHRVVDGDTLETLARRYLGSSARAHDIYEANRDVLRETGCDLLGTGRYGPLLLNTELKIPPLTPKDTVSQ